MHTRLTLAGKAVSSGRAAIPVVARFTAAVCDAERERLGGMARKLLANDPSLDRTDVFGPLVTAGLDEGPAALIGDQREIGLFARLPDQSLEHRIALLASGGDFLAVERACPAHERYLGKLLGLGALRTIALGPPVPGGPPAVAVRCRQSRQVLEAFNAAARAGGRFQIIPHAGFGACWALAGAIAGEAGVPVRVAAAPPRLAKRVNDKIWFAQRVREVLGPDALPPTFAAFGPAGVAARIRRLARNAGRVIIKTPDSAGSLGNLVLEAPLVDSLSAGALRERVLAILRARGWQGSFPLLVGVWETDAVASPSVQLWIPPPARGGPVIEGLFEQRLAGVEAEFIGAVPAQLPPRLLERICGEALRLAILLQALGYFGRCSFDCLVAGAAGGRTRVHWIECNGRWGGVSIPMTFVNRMFADPAPPGMAVVQDASLKLRVTGAAHAYALLDPLLLRRGGQAGIVPLAGGGFERGVGAYFLAVAPTQAEAEKLASEARARIQLGG